MNEIPRGIVRTICSLCNNAKLESVTKLSADELQEEIESRKEQGFTGVLRLNFKEEGSLVSLYYIFLNGSLLLTMKEVVSSGGDSTFFSLPEPEFRDGALEVLLVREESMRRVAERLPERVEVRVSSSQTHAATGAKAEPEVPEEILKFKERIMADAERAAEIAIERFRPKLDVEKLKKTKLSTEKCRRVLSFIEGELGRIFGEVKGRNLLRLRLTEMRFREGEATCADVVELIEYLRRTALRNKLGDKEADAVAELMLWKLGSIVEGGEQDAGGA
ncbi:MAG: hypothetical protein GXO66_02100 [Euryarchaeota archaeon]|nr:hypothetical protein [Euryarchaeota archaeon]